MIRNGLGSHDAENPVCVYAEYDFTELNGAHSQAVVHRTVCCVKSCCQSSHVALFMKVCQCSPKTVKLMIHVCGEKEVERAQKVHTSLSGIVHLRFSAS